MERFVAFIRKGDEDIDFDGVRDANETGALDDDTDNDGLLDWYVTSVYFSGSGKGNMLYMNRGRHHYVEVSQHAGVEHGAFGGGMAKSR